MSELQLHDSFEPYYAGKTQDRCFRPDTRWRQSDVSSSSRLRDIKSAEKAQEPPSDGAAH